MAKCDEKSADLRKKINQVQDDLKKVPALELGNVARRIKLTNKLIKLNKENKTNEENRAALKKQYDKLVESTE